MNRVLASLLAIAAGCEPDGQAAAVGPAAVDPAVATPAAVPPDGDSPASPVGRSSGSSLLPPPLRVLAVPTEPYPMPTEAPPGTPEGRVARAYQFNAPIYDAPDPRRILGFVRRGGAIPIARWQAGEGCQHGWYELATGGWVCAGLGFDPTGERLPESLRTRPPSDAPLPFRYAKITEPGTPVFSHLPTAAEEASAHAGSDEAVEFRSEGVVFLALDHVEARDDGTRFARDIRGRWVAESDLTFKPAPTMRGELLDGPDDLPLAFVHVPHTTLLDPETRTPRGVALKFARFAVQGRREIDGEDWVLGPEGLVRRSDVRIAAVVPRPADVGPDDQWVNVDLDAQVLVAYEGDRPVLATLVSSGKPGHEPPRGLFRVVKKYRTRRMSGADAVDGSYDIDQVPYTMYYWGSLALHGAYWHDTFGNVRSHGCTNLPPADAHWLFEWARPSLPEGWQGRVRLHGPWVYVTRGSPKKGA